MSPEDCTPDPGSVLMPEVTACGIEGKDLFSHATEDDLEAQDTSTCPMPKKKAEELANKHTKTQSKTRRRTWTKTLIF